MKSTQTQLTFGFMISLIILAISSIYMNIHGPMARISAFQADGSGSIPDGCNFFSDFVMEENVNINEPYLRLALKIKGKCVFLLTFFEVRRSPRNTFELHSRD